MKALTLFFIALFVVVSFTANNMYDIPDRIIVYEEIADTILLTDDFLTGTYYHAVVGQTDESPRHTSDGSYIAPFMEDTLRWCALSRDLLYVPSQWKNDTTGILWRGEYSYGDTVLVTIVDSTWGKYKEKVVGTWVIHDVMNKRFRNMIDFLVSINYLKGGLWKNLRVQKIETTTRLVPYNYVYEDSR